MVDIVSYLAMYHLFVAHMPGDTVHLEHYLVIGRLDQAAKAGVVIGMFLVGSIGGRSIIEAGAHKNFRSVATLSLLVEALLILIVVWAAPLDFARRPESLGGTVLLGAGLAGGRHGSPNCNSDAHRGAYHSHHFRDRHAEQAGVVGLAMAVLAA
jgi:uncharacterized membrane protein YoaK (UPF0700 family)